MHVVWDKLCRYFDIEPRTVPLHPDKYTIGPDEVEALIDENTIGVVGVLGHHVQRPRRRRRRHRRAAAAGSATRRARRADARRRGQRRLRLAVPPPGRVWDFRLESVRSINVSGHKFGLVYPGHRLARLPREPDDLPEDLVFYENYLGEADATFTLNFSTGSSMVLAQYYNFCRFGRAGYAARSSRRWRRNAAYLPSRSRRSASSS